MKGGKGTYGAYEHSREIGDDFSKNLRHAEYMGFRYRREDEMAKAKKQAYQDKIAKDLGITLDELQIKPTDIKDLDVPVYDYVQRTSKKITEMAERIAKNPDDMEAKILYEKYQHSVDQLKNFVEKYRAYMIDYKQGLEVDENGNRKYSPFLNKGIPDAIAKSLKSGDYKIFNDKNGALQLYIDLDKDGVNDVPALALNVPEFLGGNELYAPKPAYDPYKVQDKIAARFGTLDKTWDEKGNVIRRVKGFNVEEHAGALEEEVKQVLGSYDQKTEIGMAIAADHLGKNPEEMKKEEWDNYTKEFAKEIQISIDRIDESKEDWRRTIAENADARAADKFNYDKSQRGKGKDEEEEPNPVINLSTDKDGNPTRPTTEENGGNVFTFSKENRPKIDGKEIVRYEMGDDGEITFIAQKKVKDTDTVDGEEVETIRHEDVPITDEKKINQALQDFPNPATGKPFFTDMEELKLHSQQVKIRRYSDELDRLEKNLQQK